MSRVPGQRRRALRHAHLEWSCEVVDPRQARGRRHGHLGLLGLLVPVALLERLGFRGRPRKLALEEAEEDYQAVVAYQGAMAYVYLADRSTCPRPTQRCDWSRTPRLVFDGSRLVPISEYLQAHPRPDLLRLRERMDWLSAGPRGDRAGDVLLLARSGLERPLLLELLQVR